MKVELQHSPKNTSRRPAASRPSSPFELSDAALETRRGGWLPLSASQRQSGAVTQHELGATTMEITTVGLDLAKNVFGFTRSAARAEWSSGAL
jgi:hypothetical protein